MSLNSTYTKFEVQTNDPNDVGIYKIILTGKLQPLEETISFKLTIINRTENFNNNNNKSHLWFFEI